MPNERKRKTTHLSIRLHGDICDSTTEYIVHQTNCVSRTAGGLARTLFQRYPYADCYAHRRTRSTPGTVNIRGNGIDTRYIVNLHGQIYPGAPRCHQHTQSMDHAEIREQYFQSALTQLTAKLVHKHTNHITIAFPHNIGCGLARGSWPRYYTMIRKFTETLNQRHPAGATVEIWQYNPNKVTRPRRRR